MSEPIKPLTNRFAIITGASKGIGAAAAIDLAKAGANVAIIGRNQADLDDVAKAVEQCGQQCFPLTAELTDFASIEKLTKQLFSINPDWHILVNNAGAITNASLLESTMEQWQQLYSLNVLASLKLSQCVVPNMIERNSGRIINISSMGTFFGTPNTGAYAASKAALNQLTASMAIEWGAYNIQVNAICPTIVMTKMAKAFWLTTENQAAFDKIKQKIPLKRFPEPEEIASVITFLASDAASYLNGCIIPIDDGRRWSSA